MRRSEHQPGFSLVELLVAIAIIAVLAALAIPAIAGAQERSHSVACLGQMRQIGSAVLLYAQDNQGRFPRSGHSAGPNHEPGWAASIAPYLGAHAADATAEWINREFRCPCKTGPGTYSYGMNVFFEVGQGDSYLGRPATWRCSMQGPGPARTSLLAETRSGSGGAMTADHFMCHQWSSLTAVKNAVAHDRHSGKSNFLFVDGHVETLPIADTFKSRTDNLWNPSTAGN